MSNLQLFNQTIRSPKAQDYLTEVLAEKKKAFVTNLTALVSNDTKLQTCEPISLMYAGIKATALDLPLDKNLGFAYVIPYENRKEGKTEAQFQIGYKGFIQLAIRSGQFRTINVTEIKEGELGEHNLLTGEIAFTTAQSREKLPTIGYAAYFKLTNGFEKTLYATKEEIEQHAGRYSQTYSSSNRYVKENSKWTTDFDAMAKKTVLKLLLNKYAPLSIDMQTAVKSDQAVIDDKGIRYVDNPNAEETIAEEIRERKTINDIASQSIEQKQKKEQLNTETGEISTEE